MAPQFAEFTVAVPDAATGERALAEAWSAGALGVEERDDGSLRVFTAAADRDAVRRRVAEALGPAAHVGPAAPLPDTDWSRAWREGIEAVVISPRLAIRPDFVDFTPAPGQHVLEIDPSQAFGTGHHASTHLVLELMDAERARFAGGRVLDVGTGSGVLAMAAVVLGAAHAVGFDTDPVAVAEARANLARNRLTESVTLHTGGIECVPPGRYPCIVANLLRREMLPLLPELAERLAPDGILVLGGLLRDERAEVDAVLAAHDLGIRAAREREHGGDRWLGIVAQTGAPKSHGAHS